MTAHDPKRLLEQARQLAQREPKRPRQASLRRAVSSAYYALFHLLVQASVQLLTNSGDKHLRSLLPRAYQHEEMAAACRAFASRGPQPAIIAAIYGQVAIPDKLAAVAQAFIELQKARHDADYATHRLWTRAMTLNEVERAEQAFANWKAIRPQQRRAAAADRSTTEAVRLFLAWLVFRQKLQGRR